MGANKMKAVLMDLDGVLACNLHRIPHIHDNPLQPDWETFYNLIPHDPPLVWCSITRMMYEAGYYIIILTNRPSRYRRETMDWLIQHGVPHHQIIMREPQHHYNNAKLNAVHRLREEFEIVLAVDDDPHNISVFEGEGIPTAYVHSNYYENRVPDDLVV